MRGDRDKPGTVQTIVTDCPFCHTTKIECHSSGSPFKCLIYFFCDGKVSDTDKIHKVVMFYIHMVAFCNEHDVDQTTLNQRVLRMLVSVSCLCYERLFCFRFQTLDAP